MSGWENPSEATLTILNLISEMYSTCFSEVGGKWKAQSCKDSFLRKYILRAEIKSIPCKSTKLVKRYWLPIPKTNTKAFTEENMSLYHIIVYVFGINGPLEEIRVRL